MLLRSCPSLAVRGCAVSMGFSWDGGVSGKGQDKTRRTPKCTFPLGHRDSASLTTSPESGAAPEPRSVTLLRSYFRDNGDLASAWIWKISDW